MAKNTYALIDGVKRQTAMKEIYTSKEPIQVIPLYMGTRFQEVYDLGPILVASINGGIIPKLQTNDWPQSTTYISSEQHLATVAAHLKQLITLNNQASGEVIFRFADPLVTYHWLHSYSKATLSNIMGPIQTWQIAQPQYQWQTTALQWEIINNPNTPVANFTINNIAEPQMQAFAQAEDMRFKNKIYQWLATENPAIFNGKTAEQIGQWLNQTIAAANHFNLTTERTVAIWADLTADYGHDFASNPQGGYQQWLHANPQQQKLPADVKITHYYNQLNEQPKQA